MGSKVNQHFCTKKRTLNVLEGQNDEAFLKQSRQQDTVPISFDMKDNFRQVTSEGEILTPDQTNSTVRI